MLMWQGSEATAAIDESQYIYPYKEIILVYIILRYLFEQYINFRQFFRTMAIDMPDNLIRLNIKSDEFILSQAYANDKITFQMLSLSIKTVLECLIIMANVRPFIWDNVDQIIPFIDMKSQFQRALGYWLVYAFISKAFMVPFELYQIFIIERKHKKSTKTVTSVFFDLCVQGILFLVVIAPVIYGYLRVVEVGGEYFYVFLEIIILVVTVLYAYIFPYATIYFNKFKEISNEHLKLKINHLIIKTRFPLADIKIKVNNEHDMHGAEYMGIGKSHFIAIYESLINKLKNNENQIIAVLSHEIGHWYHKHSLKSLIVHLVQNISIFYIYSFFVHNKGISLSFGFKQQSVFMGTALFYELLTPLTAVFYYANLAMKRSFEFESDAYAVFLGHGQELKQALLSLYIDSAPMMKPDRLYSWAHFTHPTLHQRVQYIERLLEEEELLHQKWLQKH